MKLWDKVIQVVNAYLTKISPMSAHIWWNTVAIYLITFGYLTAYFPQDTRILTTSSYYGNTYEKKKIKDFDIGSMKLTPFLEQKTFLRAYQSHLKRERETF